MPSWCIWRCRRRTLRTVQVAPSHLEMAVHGHQPYTDHETVVPTPKGPHSSSLASPSGGLCIASTCLQMFATCLKCLLRREQISQSRGWLLQGGWSREVTARVLWLQGQDLELAQTRRIFSLALFYSPKDCTWAYLSMNDI